MKTNRSLWLALALAMGFLMLPVFGRGVYYQMPITFSGYTQSETLTNFPALVTFTNYKGFLSPNNGYDLRFWTNSTANGTPLNYEIDTWTNPGTSYIWVQVPTLTSGTTIWASWGNPAYNSQAVYTTNGATWANGYVVVQHMNSTNGNIVVDSTTNGNNGTLVNFPTPTSGMLGAGLAFNYLKTNYFSLPSSLTNLNAGKRATLTVWAKLNNSSPIAGNATGFNYMGNNGSGSDNYPWTDGKAYMNDLRNSRAAGISVPTSLMTNWHMVAFSSITNVWCFYQNTTLIQTEAQFGNQSTILAIPATPYIGSNHNGQYFDGGLDELRLSSVARSANWLWAEYMNMASNTVFNLYGAVIPPQGTGVFFH